VTTGSIVLIIVTAIVVVVLLGWLMTRRRRSTVLQQHFGSEYEHRLGEQGDRRAVETELRDARGVVAPWTSGP